MQKEYEHVKEDAEMLKEDLNDAVRKVRDDIATYAAYATERAQARLRDAKIKAKVKGAEIDQLAHENTWAVAAISAAVGVLVGLLLSRGRRE